MIEEKLKLSSELADSDNNECFYNGVDYSGLSSISDISFHVSNPCGFPLGSFTYFVSFCRPISRNSSEACNAVGASVCAIQEETGKIIVMAYYTGKSQIKPIQGNSTLGLMIQGENAEAGQQAFISLYCPLAEVPGVPPAEYSPWLPSYSTMNIANSVGLTGECSSLELEFSFSCACPGSLNCSAWSVPNFPVTAAIDSVGSVTTACAGPNGSLFALPEYNGTIYQATPNGLLGFSVAPFASSKRFLVSSTCVWSESQHSLYVGARSYNATGSLILKVQRNSIEEIAWFDDSALIQGMTSDGKSLFVSIQSNNETITNSIFIYSLDSPENPQTLQFNSMEGFSSIFVNPTSRILYALFESGYYAIDLNTTKFQSHTMDHPNPLSIAFSHGGATYFLTQFSYNSAKVLFPTCEVNRFDPETGHFTRLATIPECGTVLTIVFLMDSDNHLWYAGYGELMQLDIQIPK